MTFTRRWLPRNWLLFSLLLLLCVTVVAWRLWWVSSRLTTAEQALVGRWTLPIGPTPPPNARQQVIWLQADRTLLVGGRAIGEASVTFRMVGSWRLEKEDLVLEAAAAEPLATNLARIVGQAPPRARMEERLHLLGCDSDVIRVDGEAGSAGTFLRMKD
jgi:hypothetical protein